MAPRSQAIAADNAKSEKRKKSKQKTGDGADTGKKSKKRNNAFGGRAPPQLDPLLLARGMSSRYLSSKVSHKLTPLSKEAVEKDLRHMDAYRNACNGYNQQLFVFMNQGLVRSGYFGTFAPIPGADGDVIQPAMSATSKFSMPIKIDPEEEKRLSLLRKKIHQSEFDREKLETEYLSLRAHYVHESQLVRKTRSYEMGRWKLLKEVMTRRGKVLGLMRAKIAMGRDIESLLKYRGDLADKVKIGKIDIEVKDEDPPKNGDAPVSMNGGVMSTSSGTDAASEEKKVADTTPVKVVDIVQIWNTINTQLQEAEKACVEFETPAVLSQMVASSSDMASNGSRSRSPIRSDSDSGKGRKRSSSVTSEAESTTPTKKSKGAIPSELEPHIIPWDCMIEPQTPYEVPLLLSCLSSATDRAVGYLTDKTNPTAITWLGSTLPETTAAYDADAQDLAKLREEARILESELKRESERNTELQTRIIASRSRSDEMVALMQLVRSETEAVLERHNVIMETPEARAKSAELHKKLLEEAAAAGEDEEEEESSSGDEDMQGGNEEEERSDDDSVGIKEITVDKDNNAAGESDDDNDGGSDDDVGEEEEEEPRRRTTRHSQPDDEDSSMTSPNQNSNNKKRRR